MRSDLNRRRRCVVAILMAAAVLVGAPDCRATIFNVTTLSDSFVLDSKISLREALQAANSDSAVLDAPAGSGADTIQFDAGLFAGGPATVQMTGVEYQITSSLNIVGPGRDTLTLDAQQLSRHFNSSSAAAAVQISGMTLRNGKVSVTGNGPNGSGGSITNASTMTLDNVRLTNNQSSTNFISTGTTTYGGGAIYNLRATLAVQNSIVQNNSTTRAGGGLESSGGNVTITNTTFSANTSGDIGPSIAANDGTFLTLDHTTADNAINTRFFNTSPRHSKLTVTDSALGQVSGYGNTSISRSTVGNMTIFEVGTIADSNVGVISTSDYVNAAKLDVTRSTLKQVNQDYGNVTISNSTLTNAALGSRALTASQGSTLLENVTVAGYKTGLDGALYFANGSLATIRNSTITGNQANRGGGIFLATGTLNMDSTIVANNVATLTAGDVSGFVLGQYNLIEDATGAFLLSPNNILGQDPVLGPLTDNGGSTLTFQLLTGSPAIDHGSNPAGLPYDQRGFARVVGIAPDIGALERVPEPASLALLAAAAIMIRRPRTRQTLRSSQRSN